MVWWRRAWWMDQTCEQQGTDGERGLQPPEQPNKKSRDDQTTTCRTGAESSCKKRSAKKQTCFAERNEAEQRRTGRVSAAAPENAAAPEGAATYTTTATNRNHSNHSNSNARSRVPNSPVSPRSQRWHRRWCFSEIKTSQAVECDRELDRLESSSCSLTTGFST